MNSPSEILDNTRDKRIEIFLSNLNKRFDKFRDFILDGYYIKIPKMDVIPNKEYYRYKVKFPISYETTAKYRIRLHNHIFDLYKHDCNYYFMDIMHNAVPTYDLFKKFTTTIQFSFIYNLMYNMLSDIHSRNISINLSDMVFMGLLNQFHTPNGDLKLTLTPLSVKNKIMTDDHLYISLFN